MPSIYGFLAPGSCPPCSALPRPAAGAGDDEAPRPAARGGGAGDGPQPVRHLRTVVVRSSGRRSPSAASSSPSFRHQRLRRCLDHAVRSFTTELSISDSPPSTAPPRRAGVRARRRYCPPALGRLTDPRCARRSTARPRHGEAGAAVRARALAPAGARLLLADRARRPRAPRRRAHLLVDEGHLGREHLARRGRRARGQLPDHGLRRCARRRDRGAHRRCLAGRFRVRSAVRSSASATRATASWDRRRARARLLRHPRRPGIYQTVALLVLTIRSTPAARDRADTASIRRSRPGSRRSTGPGRRRAEVFRTSPCR